MLLFQGFELQSRTDHLSVVLLSSGSVRLRSIRRVLELT